MPATKQTATRKHFYLVTEHEDSDQVGRVSIGDSRLANGSKNEETAIHTFDEDTGDFEILGKRVSMGYIDFESEDDYEENIGDAVRRKLGEIDERHLHKAGLDPNEVLRD